MTRPDPRRQAAALAASASFAGAIDLSPLKARAVAPAAGAGADAPATAAGVPAGAAAPSPFVIDITEASFGQVVQASSQVLVVVELWDGRADRAAQLSPALEQLAGEAGGSWILARADIATQPRIAQAFGVQAVPTVIAVAAGQPVDGLTGVLAEPQARQWISGLLDALRDQLPGIKEAEAQTPPAELPTDPRFLAAEEKLDAGDLAGAAEAYRAILAQEPANAEAAAALNQTEFLARVADHPTDAVAQADAAPDDVVLQTAAADVEVAAGQVVEAFDRLIGTVRRTAGDDRTAAREHLVSLFALFPTDDPQVVAARRKLAAALF
jgi:putative thioredoxin